MTAKKKVSIFWFRRDLRLDDNHGLSQALKGDFPVLPLFIFDKKILDDLTQKDDARLTFIHQQLRHINSQLKEKNTCIQTYYDTPERAFGQLLNQYEIHAVYTNRDYEPYAKERDEIILTLIEAHGGTFYDFKDQVIFERDEIIKSDGNPYQVYSPYSRKWLEKITEKDLNAFPSAMNSNNWFPIEFSEITLLKQMGFSPSSITIPPNKIDKDTLVRYEKERDYPDLDSTSRLGIHLRFGTVSIRKIATKASALSLTFYKELIWREFFMMILDHFPHVVSNNFNRKYDSLVWRNNEAEFQKWCAGETGYTLVDAGMKELNQTGFMHNRVRMVVASFLCKHLLIDWRWGEAYFAEKLLDFELASNNGNWQWAAGTGVDAAPYFRVFNPISQADKFDKQYLYRKKWLAHFDPHSYLSPMVDHSMARNRAISTYKKALAG